MNGEPIAVADGISAPYREFAVGDAWGRAWGTTWFRLTGVVPPEFAGRHLEIVFDLGFDRSKPGFQAEALVYRGDGTPVRSLHPLAQWIPVSRTAARGERIEFFVEASSNPLILDDDDPFRVTLEGDWATSNEALLYRVQRADLCVFEEEVFDLVHDVEVLLELAEQLPAESTRRARVLVGLGRALDRLDLTDIDGTASAARETLAPLLAAPASQTSHRIAAVGHAHIDSAWLWPLRETVRKVARTASSMVTLIDEHDEFVYAMSSAQQYAWLKQHRPEVFERVRQAVAGGRFVPVGGMWVEADAVLPSGEALIRQFTYGQRFFRDEFGIECRGAWLPDSFGYSAALPQLLVGAGFEWFLTQKLSWNERNPFPHSTFLWEGVDGSRIFTHFPPVDTYSSQLSGAELALAARQFREKAVASSSLAPTGWGDGGGGTTREMIARARRLADLEGSPRVSWEKPDAFFARAKEELPEPPVWRGELYLELHRGTYTTQHAMKQGNRRSEVLAVEAELWSAAAAVRVGHPYPYDALDAIWRDILLLQFHDILPGSSIAWVHREARDRYADIATRLEDIVGSALGALGAELDPDGDLSVNAAPVAAAGVRSGAIDAAAPARVSIESRDDGSILLTSGSISAQIDADGLVVHLIDLASGRDAIPAGSRGNLLQLHQDFPNLWDAWDVDQHYRGTRRDLAEGASVRVEGTAVVVERSFGNSSIEQRISIGLDGAALVIDNRIDWREREKFLKLAFPVDVFADTALAETQFGYQTRATHENTSWDDARFETHAQRWFLVQEPGFGVAFANDSTYGFDVTRVERDGRITQDARFSLLRAPRYPDPETDQGVQTMRVAIVPGADVAAATATGHLVNASRRTVRGTALGPLVASSTPAVLVSAVKLADDRSGDLIVRVYEALGARAHATLQVAGRWSDGHRVDLLERITGAVPLTQAADASSIAVDLRPFEVATFRLRRVDSGR
ncbi:glycoside hydrolase family 38 C-terminal domain-containing protein [Galbitalea sp. SE-J8]|uniref:alpha-mannosidase n=1 Tax=Galbitalea sp. SE-J8 TaxID=3054952 RepID=UPI0033906260